jgi:hypothetical protein
MHGGRGVGRSFPPLGRIRGQHPGAPGLDVRASRRAGRPIVRGQARGMVWRWGKGEQEERGETDVWVPRVSERR